MEYWASDLGVIPAALLFPGLTGGNQLVPDLQAKLSVTAFKATNNDKRERDLRSQEQVL